MNNADHIERLVLHKNEIFDKLFTYIGVSYTGRISGVLMQYNYTVKQTFGHNYLTI